MIDVNSLHHIAAGVLAVGKNLWIPLVLVVAIKGFLYLRYESLR